MFLCSSATIANPRELAERLTEQPFELVDQSGAPRGEKFFVFVNPPVVNHQLGIRRSYLGETRRIASEFLKRNLQLIVFAQSRLATEILTTYLKDDFEGVPGAPERIRGYRGGYLPNCAGARSKKGCAKARSARSSRPTRSSSASTSARSTSSVMAGYPGTIAATWQRAGRAGRRAGRSAAVMVASSAPLDQFIVRNPSYFFDASPERALIDPDNLHILVDHIKCAAFELPFTPSEAFGRHDVQEILGVLAEQGLVHRSGAADELDDAADGHWTWTNESYPADAVSLRSVSSDNFVVVDTTRETRVIGETDFTSGPATLHPKAIYIVEGKLYQVERLDFEGRKAFVREIDCDYYTTRSPTRASRSSTRSPNRDRRPSRASVARRSPRRLARGRLQEDQVLHERERRLRRARSARAADAHDVVLADDSGGGDGAAAVRVRRSARRRRRAGVRDAAGRAAAADVRRPRHRHLDRHRRAGDAGDRRRRARADRSSSTTTIPGGIGFSEPLFSMHDELLDRHAPADRRVRRARTAVPGCVGPVGNTGPLAKAAALRILDLLLGTRRG